MDGLLLARYAMFGVMGFVSVVVFTQYDKTLGGMSMGAVVALAFLI